LLGRSERMPGVDLTGQASAESPLENRNLWSAAGLRQQKLAPLPVSPGQLLSLAYPAADHGQVEIDHRRELHLLRLRILQLDVEQASLRIEHFNVASIAVVVAQPGGCRVLLQCPYLLFLRA